MPGDGELRKLYIGNRLIDYLPHGAAPLVVEEPDGTRTEVTLEALEAAVALSGVPTADPEDGETVWSDEGVLKVASSG